MKRIALTLVLVLAACGTNNTTENNGEENSLNVFANNFDACGDADACADGEECVQYEDGEHCVPMERPARVLLEDTSTDCSDTDAYPGVSIIWVTVDKRDGTELGNGRVIAETAGSPVAADRGLEPDGSPVTADACDSGFNLGCGGSAVIDIVDALGESVDLREGQELQMQIRADAECDSGSPDSFTLTVCDDPEAVVGGDTASCATPWAVTSTAPGAFSGELTSWGPAE